MALIDLSGISDAANVAKTLSGLILVSPQKEVGIQPQDEDGFPEGKPILFHTLKEEQVSLESDITDHYIEDNTVLNDQIALKPEMFTVGGLIGELNNVVPPGLKIANLVAEKLLIMAPYTPDISAAALTTYNQAEQLYRTAVNAKKNAVRSWESLSGKGTLNEIGSDGLRDDVPGESQTLQQIYFQQFYGYWRNRTLFTVQTPWAIFKNMAIKSLRAVQNEDDINSSDFEITFKIMRFAKTTLSESLFANNSGSGRNGNQKAGVTNLGTQSPSLGPTMTSAI